MPIRRWQVWNEPNLNYFWSSEPFADTYVTLLRAAHDAIKAADPGAQVILAGLANDSWNALDTIYQVSGAQRLFDAVAVHPYTAQAAGVLRIVRLVRTVMNRYGDKAKPVLVTELGWPSSLGRVRQTFGLATTQQGQARRLADVIPMLAAARRQLGIAGFDVYTWLGDEASGSTAFNYSGLFSYTPASDAIRAKPAFAAFRAAALSVEGCRVKAADASRCRRTG
jgi:arabinogalactan endo-1,4-beta-galactosidase